MMSLEEVGRQLVIYAKFDYGMLVPSLFSPETAVLEISL